MSLNEFKLLLPLKSSENHSFLSSFFSYLVYILLHLFKFLSCLPLILNRMEGESDFTLSLFLNFIISFVEYVCDKKTVIF